MAPPKKWKSLIGPWVALALFSGLFFLSVRAQSVDKYAQYLPVINRDHNPLWTWLPESAVELLPRPNHLPLLAIDHGGNVHLLWDTPVAPRFIYHTIYDGATWTTPEPITETLGISDTIHPPIFDNQGTLHLIYHNYLGAGVSEPFRLLYTTYDGTWRLEGKIYRTSLYTLEAMPQFDDTGGDAGDHCRNLSFLRESVPGPTRAE